MVTVTLGCRLDLGQTAGRKRQGIEGVGVIGSISIFISYTIRPSPFRDESTTMPAGKTAPIGRRSGHHKMVRLP